MSYPTPGKLSQVLLAEVLIIGCDKHTQVPVNVEIKTIKSGYSSFFMKFIIAKEFFVEHQRVLFDS